MAAVSNNNDPARRNAGNADIAQAMHTSLLNGVDRRAGTMRTVVGTTAILNLNNGRLLRSCRGGRYGRRDGADGYERCQAGFCKDAGHEISPWFRVSAPLMGRCDPRSNNLNAVG